MTGNIFDDIKLPVGWDLTTVGEISDLIQYGTSEKANLDRSGTVVLRMGNIQEGKLSFDNVKFLPQGFGEEEKFLLEDGDVLFNRTNSAELVGKTAVYHENHPKALFASYLIRIKTRKTAYNPDLLAFFINSVYGRKYISSVVSQQVGQANVNGTKLAAMPIPIPPRPEQTRIVSKIDELLSQLETATEFLRKVQTQLKRYRQAVLKYAVEGKLTAEWREKHKGEIEPADQLLKRILEERRAKWEEQELAKMKAKGKAPKDDKWRKKYKEPAAPDTDGLPELPERWCWCALPQSGEMARGKSKHRPRNDPKLFGGAYPFIQTGEISRATGPIKEAGAFYSDFGLQQSRMWPAGTLCITIAANIAHTAILGIECCFPDSVVGVIPDEKLVSAQYLDTYMKTVRDDLDSVAPATAQKNINLGILDQVAVPIPPVAERKEIEERVRAALETADQIEQLIDKTLSRTRTLSSSILVKAFLGGLVPQDPAEEPALVLLERIKAEREQAQETNKKSKPRIRRSKTKGKTRTEAVQTELPLTK